MELNTDQLHTNIIEIRDELEQDMKHLDRSSASYKYMLIYHDKLNKALEDCYKYLKEKVMKNE